LTANPDVLIIGGGPAGLTAAVYACRAGLSAVVLEKESAAGGQMATTPEIENMPGFPPVDGYSLSVKMTGQAKALGAEIVSHAAEELDLASKPLRVKAAGQVYLPKTVILAMGARRRKLDIPGEREFFGRGVSYCAVCDGNFFKNKPVAVVGGGNTALEDALHLAALGCDVTLIHRRDDFRGSPLLLDRVRNAPGIRILTPYIPIAVEGEAAAAGITVSHAQTGGTQTIPINGVFICAGTVANTELLAGQLPLGEQGRVAADESCETGIPGVYAAGDLRAKTLYQIVTAAADGAVAATRAAGFVGR
jgi:thioredoxin reductase (NADPH)